MNYESQNELLSAYLDGELTADERAQVEHLLATKPAARKMLEELRTLSATLKSLPRQKMGEDLSDIVLRTAELRMLTEAADGETAGTCASEEQIHEEKIEPAPVYSTILRRLKIPRMWVWEIVIVAVAVLLVVYYPNQNANRNAAVRKCGTKYRHGHESGRKTCFFASVEHAGGPIARQSRTDEITGRANSSRKTVRYNRGIRSCTI